MTVKVLLDEKDAMAIEWALHQLVADHKDVATCNTHWKQRVELYNTLLKALSERRPA